MLCQATLVVSKRKQYYSNGLFFGRLLVTGRQSTGGLIFGDSIRGKQQYKSLTWASLLIRSHNIRQSEKSISHDCCNRQQAYLDRFKLNVEVYLRMTLIERKSCIPIRPGPVQEYVLLEWWCTHTHTYVKILNGLGLYKFDAYTVVRSRQSCITLARTRQQPSSTLRSCVFVCEYVCQHSVKNKTTHAESNATRLRNKNCTANIDILIRKKTKKTLRDTHMKKGLNSDIHCTEIFESTITVIRNKNTNLLPPPQLLKNDLRKHQGQSVTTH
ncbi:hypothetical protein QTP88_017319 [Uroleucon formosanum]